MTPRQTYIAKANADTRFAATMTIGETAPDQAAPPVTVDYRRQALARALEIPHEGKRLDELELMVAEAMGVQPLPAAPASADKTKKGK